MKFGKWMKFGKMAALAGLVLVSGAAGAATIWEPTDVVADGNVNIIVAPGVGLTLNGGTLALFEDTDVGFSTPLALGSAGGILAFTDVGGGNYKVEAFSAGISQGMITINGFEFVLGVNWGSGYVGDVSTVQNGGDLTSYLINFTDGVNSGNVFAVDLTPIPLPAAAWLFGSALIGLAALSRRRR